MRISLQPVHHQRAEDHGQVGAAHPHLAAEEERRQPPGLPAVAQRQAGALLEGGAEEREGGADWCIDGSLLSSFSPRVLLQGDVPPIDSAAVQKSPHLSDLN